KVAALQLLLFEVTDTVEHGSGALPPLDVQPITAADETTEAIARYFATAWIAYTGLLKFDTAWKRYTTGPASGYWRARPAPVQRDYRTGRFGPASQTDDATVVE